MPLPLYNPPQANIDPVELFDAIWGSFKLAERAAGGCVRHQLQIADQSLELCFAGQALVPYLLPALSHRLAPLLSAVPDLTVYLWDSHSTGTPLPPQALKIRRYRRRYGEVRGLVTDRINTHFQEGPDALYLLDLHRRIALYWIDAADQVPAYNQAAPLQPILHVWLSHQGLHLVHAGAVGLPEGGALLVGHGGAGKSNTALACLTSSLLGYASDDYCLLGAAPQPVVHSLYSTGKTLGGDVQHLPHLQQWISNPDRPDNEKALYFLHEHLPHKILQHFPLKVILLPSVTTHRDTTLAPVSAATGLRIIAPNTLLQWPSVGHRAFQSLTKVFRQVPSYRLNLGWDRAQIPTVITNLLLQLQGSIRET